MHVKKTTTNKITYPSSRLPAFYFIPPPSSLAKISPTPYLFWWFLPRPYSVPPQCDCWLSSQPCSVWLLIRSVFENWMVTHSQFLEKIYLVFSTTLLWIGFDYGWCNLYYVSVTSNLPEHFCLGSSKSCTVLASQYHHWLRAVWDKRPRLCSYYTG